MACTPEGYWQMGGSNLSHDTSYTDPALFVTFLSASGHMLR
jgi:hypothetical protein